MDPRDLPNVPPMLTETARQARATGLPEVDALLAEVHEHGHAPTWQAWRAKAEAGLAGMPPTDAAALRRLIDRVDALLAGKK